MLARPPTIDERAFAKVDGEWRTAREIYARIGEEAFTTARLALTKLARDGKIERGYRPHPAGLVACYRRLPETAPDAS